MGGSIVRSVIHDLYSLPAVAVCCLSYCLRIEAGKKKRKKGAHTLVNQTERVIKRNGSFLRAGAGESE